MGSNPITGTVAVAEMAMHRIVAPDYAGPNPVGHIMHYIRNEVLYEK